MKRKLVAAILGVAASLAVTSAYAQGRVVLDNYNTYGPYLTYHADSGAPAGTPIVNNTPADAGAWTIGFYWAVGDVRGGVGPDSTGFGEVPTWANGLQVAAGPGGVGNLAAPGAFIPSDANDFVFPGVVSGQVTISVFAYAGGADYTTALYRGHSSAFLLTPTQGPGFAIPMGSAMPGFALHAVPEPSTFALAGLGAAAMLILRRRK